MEKEFIISIEIDYFSTNNRGEFCNVKIPFYGTKEDAKKAALGISDAYEKQALSKYSKGWSKVSVDNDIIYNGGLD